MHAKELVQKFGGQTKLAKELGIGQSAIAYWVKMGRIPVKWHEKLLKLAVARGIDIHVADLIGVDLSENITKSSHIPYVPPVHSGHEVFLPPSGSRDFLFYESDKGTVKVQVLLTDETVWASQKGMGEIFDVESNTINEHLKNIFKTNELDESTTTRKFRTVVDNEKEYNVNYYSLDVIIAVGYRVNSFNATQFRKWATTVLREYLIKGFTLDDERLKQGGQLFGKDYFDELLERIRDIRASERMFYQKITDIYSQCSIDYDPNSPLSQQFYAHVQDKFHYAIHGHTSAELIQQRADASKPHMGLTTWKNAGKDGRVTKTDVMIGKNYLNYDEASELNRLVSMFLDYAENFARRHIPQTMKDWAGNLDNFLSFNAYEVLQDFGKMSREQANQRAIREYEKFKVQQDKKYKSDFDKMIDKIKSKGSQNS